MPMLTTDRGTRRRQLGRDAGELGGDDPLDDLERYLAEPVLEGRMPDYFEWVHRSKDGRAMAADDSRLTGAVSAE